MGNMSCTSMNNIASRNVSIPKKKYIVLQGNIGAGKSTLFNELSKRFENNTSVCMPVSYTHLTLPTILRG